MAKKKILIINKSFQLGGIQTALANMLKAINNDYEVSLAIFNPNGPIKERIPENVKLLELSPMVQVLGMSWGDCKKYGTLFQCFFKIVTYVWSKIFSNRIPVSIALAFQKKLIGYDVVISYHQETLPKTSVTGFGRFAIEKCVAPTKIAWVHADFLATKLNTPQNLETYKKFNKIVSVSRTTMDTFIKAYPELKDKCDYCYNYVHSEEVIKKSKTLSNVFKCKNDDIVLFSACRLAEEKGIVPAIENLMYLFKQKNNIKWYIAGNGALEKTINDIIIDNNLEDSVILLGYENNPYPYIYEADYLFLPSLHETYSMVVKEAHILGTRVIASDIPIMHEVLNENDILCKDYDFCKYIRNILNKYEKNFSNDSDDSWKLNFKKVIDS